MEEELLRLEQDGIIEPVEFADWAAPIVPVLKGTGQNVRICGDFKLTVNKASRLDTYPLPRIDDLYASLAGGQSFTKLDLKNAYLQIELEEESKKCVTINTVPEQPPPVRSQFISIQSVRAAQSAFYTSPLTKPVHSDTNSTSLVRIQPSCNYFTKTIPPLSIVRYSFVQLRELQFRGLNQNTRALKQQ